MNITKQIIKARKNAKCSCYQACKVTGLSKGLLSNLESGKNKNPTVNTLWRLATAYKCKFTIG